MRDITDQVLYDQSLIFPYVSTEVAEQMLYEEHNANGEDHRGNKPLKLHPGHDNDIRRMYVDDCRSIVYIAKELGISRTFVRGRMAHLGITIRGVGKYDRKKNRK